MQVLKYVFTLILIIICIVVVFFVGLRFARDEKDTKSWLDNYFGQGTYKMEQDPEKKDRWVVMLKEYPKIHFHCNVFHDWIALGSPIVQTDFKEVFYKNAIKEFNEGHDIGSDEISFFRQGGLTYSAEIKSIEDLKEHYDNGVAFIEFARKEYPILLDKSLLYLTLHIKVNTIQTKSEFDKWISTRITTVNKDGRSIKSYEEVYNELKAEYDSIYKNGEE